MNKTLMCWGFECGDGWFALIDTLCASLMHPVKQARDAYQSRLDTRERIETGSVTADQKGFDFLKDYSSDAAIAAAIAETENPSLKQMGVVMKAAQAKLAGKRVDGKALS